MSKRNSLGPPAVPKHSTGRSQERYNLRKSTAWDEIKRANLDTFKTQKRRSYNFDLSSSRSSSTSTTLSPKSMTSFERQYLLPDVNHLGTIQTQQLRQRIGPDQIYDSASVVGRPPHPVDHSSQIVSVRRPLSGGPVLSRDILINQAVLLHCGSSQTTSDCLNSRPYLLRERLQKLKREAITKLLSLPSRSSSRAPASAALIQIYQSPHSWSYLRVTYASNTSQSLQYPGSTIIHCGYFPDKTECLAIIVTDHEAESANQRLICHLFSAVSHWSAGRHSAHSPLADLFGLPCSAQNIAHSSQIVVTPGGRCNSLDFPTNCIRFVDQIVRTCDSRVYHLGLISQSEESPIPPPRHVHQQPAPSSRKSSSKESPHDSITSGKSSAPPNIVVNSTDSSVFKRPLTPKISNSCENLQKNVGVLSYARKSFRNKQLFQSQESISSMSNHSGSSMNPFDVLLNDSKGIKLFEKFCCSQYSAENIHFWIEVNEFKILKNKAEITKKSRKIFDKYFDPQGTETININSAMFKFVKDNVKNPDPTLFHDIQEHIYNLMRTDIYPRFKESAFYLDYQNGTEKEEPRRRSFLPFFRKTRKSQQKQPDSLPNSPISDRKSLSKSPSNISSIFKKPMSVRQMKANVGSPGTLKKADSVKSFNSEELNTPTKEKNRFLDFLSRVQSSGLNDQRGSTIDQLEMPDFIKSPKSVFGSKMSDSNMYNSQPADLNSFIFHGDQQQDSNNNGSHDMLRSSPYLARNVTPRKRNKSPFDLLDLPIGGSLTQIQPPLQQPQSNYSQPVSPSPGKHNTSGGRVASPSTPKVHDQRKRFSTLFVELSSSDRSGGGCVDTEKEKFPSPNSRIGVSEADELGRLSTGFEYSAEFGRSSRTQSNATAASLFTDEEDEGEEDERIILV